MMRLILFFTLSFLMFGGTSMAENQITCNADMLPIQAVVNEDERPVTTLYGSNRGSDFSGISSFNYLIKTVTEHLAAKLAQEKLCLNNAESQKGSLVQFVYPYMGRSQVERTLFAERTLFKVWPPAENKATVCQIASPWLDIIIEKEPVPKVQAIVRFNKWQFLADQAVLEGALNVPPGVALPLTYEEYGQYQRIYSDWLDYIYMNDPPLKNPIEEQVPPDFLWILKRAVPTRQAGAVHYAIDELIDSQIENYTKVVTTLIDECFASNEVNIKVNSILDVPNAALLKKYKSDITEQEPIKKIIR